MKRQDGESFLHYKIRRKSANATLKHKIRGGRLIHTGTYIKDKDLRQKMRKVAGKFNNYIEEDK